MKEYNVTIEIDEDGNIEAQTQGMKGKVCINELDNILKNINGEQNYKNKPEYYTREENNIKQSTIKNHF